MLDKRTKELGDGLKRIAGIGEMPFAAESSCIQTTGQVTISRNSDEQMFRLHCYSHDAYTRLSFTC